MSFHLDISFPIVLPKCTNKAYECRAQSRGRIVCSDTHQTKAGFFHRNRFVFPLEKIPSVFNFCKRVLFEEFIVSFSLFYIDPGTPEKVSVNVWSKNSSDKY